MVKMVIYGKDTDIKDEFLAQEMGVSSDDLTVLFPEYSKKHPKTIVDETVAKIEKAVSQNKNVYIATMNDLVFQALRVYAYEHNDELDASVTFYRNDGRIEKVGIDKNGRLSYWPEDCNFFFDLSDRLLDKLVFPE